MDVVVLNTLPVTLELLDKRSEVYSDRPSTTSLVAPCYDFNFAFAPYGEQWRLCRRIFQQTFHADAALRFRPMQLGKARQLVSNLIVHHEEYPFHYATFSSSIALSAVYDYEPKLRNDPLVAVIDKFLHVAVGSLAPEKGFLLKAFPFLLHVPDWFPGSWIKRDIKEAYALRTKMVELPYKTVLERMEAKERINPSMVLDNLTQMDKSDASYGPEYETALKYAAATTLNASADTTTAILMTFTLVMVENPHVWKRAQADIDAVVGTDRLPEFDDRPSLPYIDAIIREVIRWRPALPLGGPHSLTRSDVYDGYYIPKGAIVLQNVWAMSRDEARYPDADKYLPERFVNAEGMLTDDDPREFTFGFGRRRCPGRHVADASVWSGIATMLATLDFNLAKDADGNDITFKATFTNGATEHPNPFPCRLAPRAHVTKDMLERYLTK
ncbi:Cytochrome P450 [Tylopilus felleus]